MMFTVLRCKEQKIRVYKGHRLVLTVRYRDIPHMLALESEIWKVLKFGQKLKLVK